MNREENLCWFHGKISRERAEEILRQEGPSDGVFLVRDSNTSDGDYVLSVLYEREVLHYQIRRHGDDAFFSIEDHTPIHGLDSLIEHYRESSHGLITKLSAICRSEPPPHGARSHGTTNLLHRATKESNYTVVSELLKCGYRNIDSKNQNGQTAVHLACLFADDKILKILIERGSNINNRDAQGNTALHYACRKTNSIAMVKLLVEAKANLQARNNETGLVPLHEAATSGNLDAVKELLSNKAPHMPRSNFGELPIDLARGNDHTLVVEYLKIYVPPLPTTHKGQWYHGTLDRQAAVDSLSHFARKMVLLNENNTKETLDNENNENLSNEANDETELLTSGAFLVRYSDKNSGYNVLTLLYRNEAKNYKIEKQQNLLYIDEGPYMLSLEHLVDHYKLFPDGLPVNLLYPVPPTPKPPIPLFATMPKLRNKMKKSPISTSLDREVSFKRKSSEGTLKKTHPSPQRNLSVPNEDMMQMNKLGIFDRSAESDKSLSPRPSPRASPNNDERKTKDKFASLKSPKKRNIIIDGMMSLRIRKNKNKPIEDPAANRESITQISNSNLITSLSFSSDFRDTLNQDQLYNTPTNNCAIFEIDIGESHPSISATASNDNSINNNNVAEDYYTKSDIDILADTSPRDNVEEIYFVDAPPPTEVKLPQNNHVPTTTNYIIARNIPVFNDCNSLCGDNDNDNVTNNNNTTFNRLDSTMSTLSQESSDNEYLQIIQQQQDEDEEKHLKLNKNSTNKPNYFIPKENLVLQEVLGEGEFGSVHKGVFKSSQLFDMSSNSNDEADILVAIKTLHDEHCKRNREAILREASVMIRLRHHCIVKLIGICKGPPLMMVQELVPLGSMLEYIVTNSAKINPNHEIIIWASQIARGMQYLESQHYVHRDLAARNILLASKYQAKISDFGLSRALGAGNDYYQASQGGKWPIKWYAPESFNFGTFSHASDVWSFGVTLWEMFSLGQPPYFDMKGVEVIKLINQNQRLSQPEFCPENIFGIMQKCWDYNPKNRPKFKFLTRFLASHIDYQNLEELVQNNNLS